MKNTTRTTSRNTAGSTGLKETEVQELIDQALREALSTYSRDMETHLRDIDTRLKNIEKRG